MRAFTASDLNGAPSLTKVMDKFGVTYVKLEDEQWLSNELQVVKASALAKRRVNVHREDA